MRRELIVALLWLNAAMPAGAEEGARVVRTAVGQAVEVVVEEGVGDLVRSGDPLSLKVEHTAGHLFITPMSDAPAELTVIDQRGGSHLLKFVVAEPAERKIIIKDAPLSGPGIVQGDEVMGLMRQLIRQETPAGSTAEAGDAVLFDDGKLRLRRVVVYTTLRLLGYDVVAENLLQEPVAVPLQRIMVRGLLAIWTEKDTLAPGEKCRINMAVRR